MISNHHIANLAGYGMTAAGTVVSPLLAITPPPGVSPEALLTTIIASIFTGLSGLLILVLSARDKRQQREQALAQSKIDNDTRVEERKLDNDARFRTLADETAEIRTKAAIQLALRDAEAVRLNQAKAEADAIIAGLRAELARVALAVPTAADSGPPKAIAIVIAPPSAPVAP